MKLLRLKYNPKGLNGVTACHHSTHQKYVNEALGGKINFENDFRKNHIETSSFQKLLLSLGSGFMSITDPRRGDMVAVMGESTGALAFDYIRKKMLQSAEGRQILEERPRISSASVNLEELKQMPEGTLGKAYSNFLERYKLAKSKGQIQIFLTHEQVKKLHLDSGAGKKFGIYFLQKYSPDERLAVRFVDDLELAYVAQRYREAHDLFHTILDMPTNMLGEVTVKWVEAIQTRLPMCITGALFGPLRLAPKLTRTYATNPIAALDSAIIDGIRAKKFQIKNHPGKIEVKQLVIPEKLENSIDSALKKSRISLSDKEIEAYKTTIFSKILPVEGLKKEVLITNFKNNFLETLSKKNQKLDSNKLETIINNKVKDFEKHLMVLSKSETFDKKKCLMYLKARARYEYAALLKVFSEITHKDPMFKPKSLFDFGSGVGTVTWAASTLWKESLIEYFTVDACKEMNDLAYSIIHPDPNKKPYVKGFLQRQFLPANDLNFDIVVSAFSFSYLTSYEDRMQKLNSLWNKTSKYLVVVENGTNVGFRIINEVREMLIQQSSSLNFKCYVLAPCPHDLVCPRFIDLKEEPCKFRVKYREIKNGKEQHTETPYSYVIIKKEKRPAHDKQWPRLLSDVSVRSRHFYCDMCTAEGTVKRVIFTKSKCGSETYQCGKKLEWGDCFPGEVKNTTNTDENDVIDNHEKQRMKYVTSYLPWAIETGMNSGFLMNIYFEKRWAQTVSSLYQEYNIKPLVDK